MGKNVRATARHRLSSISHGSLSTFPQHTTYFTILLRCLTTRALVLIPSPPAMSPHQSYLLLKTYLFFQETNSKCLKKIACLLQQEMIHRTTTALARIFLQSSACLWSGDAMPSHHRRLLLIASSGRTPLIQKSRISRKKMYAKMLQENESCL